MRKQNKQIISSDNLDQFIFTFTNQKNIFFLKKSYDEAGSVLDCVTILLSISFSNNSPRLISMVFRKSLSEIFKKSSSLYKTFFGVSAILIKKKNYHKKLNGI